MSGHRVPKGWRVQLMLAQAQRDILEFQEDAGVFRPERCAQPLCVWQRLSWAGVPHSSAVQGREEGCSQCAVLSNSSARGSCCVEGTRCWDVVRRGVWLRCGCVVYNAARM